MFLNIKGFLVKKRSIRAAHPRSAKYVSTPPPRILPLFSPNFWQIFHCQGGTLPLLTPCGYVTAQDTLFTIQQCRKIKNYIRHRNGSKACMTSGSLVQVRGGGGVTHILRHTGMCCSMDPIFYKNIPKHGSIFPNFCSVCMANTQKIIIFREKILPK